MNQCLQALNRRIPEKCVANLIRHAATSTDVRKKKIFELLSKFNYNAIPAIQEFGVHVGNQFQKVDARMLPPPTLDYKNCTITPAQGFWRSERNKFIEPPSETKTWGVLNLDRRTVEQGIRKFETLFMDVAKLQGISFEKLKLIRHAKNFAELVDSMGVMKKAGIHILFVILSDQSNNYPSVKIEAETNYALLTQCIKAKTLQRINNSCVSNIMMKVIAD